MVHLERPTLEPMRMAHMVPMPGVIKGYCIQVAPSQNINNLGLLSSWTSGRGDVEASAKDHRKTQKHLVKAERQEGNLET